MPHTIETLTGEVARQQATIKPPFGPGFTTEQAAKAHSMVITGSSFEDPGEDWVEFKLLGEDGQAQASRRTAGY